MILVLLCLALQAGAPRAALAEVEFRGPCARVDCELPGAGGAAVRFEPSLAEGERRTLRVGVPLPADPLPAQAWSRALAAALEATGRARLVALAPPAALGAVATELLARPRPELATDAAHGRASLAVLFVLAAAFAITASRRRRPVLVTAIALAACASIFLLTRAQAAVLPRELVLFEARGGAESREPWLEVQAARGAFPAADLARGRIETRPVGAPVRLASGPAPGAVTVRAHGAAIYQLREFDPGMRRLAREYNAVADFEAAWFRDAGGAWRSLGPWAFGEPLPGGVPGDPPGRLVPALPMGTSIFLGRLADPAALRAGAGPAAPEAWIRGVGL